jgi:hypothetical protein
MGFTRLDISESSSLDWLQSDDSADLVIPETLIHDLYIRESTEPETLSSESAASGDQALEVSSSNYGVHPQATDDDVEITRLERRLTPEQMGDLDWLANETGLDRLTVIRTFVASHMDLDVTMLSLIARTP